MKRAFILLLVAAVAFAIPQTLEYQGKLTDMSGIGENDTLPMTFKLFDLETGGDSLWVQTVADVPIVHGLFDVDLGPIDLPFDEQYWLEITVDGNVLAPRMALTSSPYAFRAAVADSFTGGIAPWTQDTMVAHWDSLRGAPDSLVEGVGVMNYIPIWLDDSTLGSSNIYNTVGHIGMQKDVNISYRLTVDTILSVPSDTLYLPEKVWMDELITDSIEARGDVVKMRDALYIEDSLYFGGAWRHDWPGGGFQRLHKSGSAWLTDSVTFVEGENISLTQTGNNIEIAASGGDQIIVVDATNYTTVDVQSNWIVNFREVIALPGGTDFDDWNRKDNLFITGGGFSSTSLSTFEMGDNWVVSGAYFDNVQFEGNYPTFIDCEFRNISGTFPWGSNFVGCSFYNVSETITYSIGTMSHCDIENSTILRANRITDSKISSCTIAGTALNFEMVGNITDNSIYDSRIYMRRSTMFANNHCDESVLVFCDKSYGQITISGNVFDNLKDGETEAIQIDCESSGWKNWMISDNTFIIQSDDPQAIRAFNNDGGGSYSILKISGNSFLKGAKALNITSNIKAAISDNVTRQTSLGTTGSGCWLNDNHAF